MENPIEMSSFSTLETFVGVLQTFPIVSALAILTKELVVVVPILPSIAIHFPFVIVTILVGLDILILGQLSVGQNSSFSIDLLLFIKRSILFS